MPSKLLLASIHRPRRFAVRVSTNTSVARCLRRAIEKANELTKAVLEQDAFWRSLTEGSIEVTERQQELINRLLDGFEGKFTTRKWAKIKKISQDSALRDSQSLIEKGIL